MNSDSETDEICTAPDILGAKITCMHLLPEKSKKKYEAVYQGFMEWRNLKDNKSLSEKVLLDYFRELSEKYKSPSLWAQYSMLKSTLNINNGINIEHYTKLRAFLKRKAKGYQGKKTKTFTSDEINKFINEAPDTKYLVTKVALIMGVMGACHANELHLMNYKNMQDLGSALLVTIPNSAKTKNRNFTVTGQFYQICKKYIDLRPSNSESNAFFLNYQKGKCTAQKIGINKLGAMGKQIASFLQLPNPEMYTGHTFRRTSAAVVCDAGVFPALSSLSGCTSPPARDESANHSVKTEEKTPDQIFHTVKHSNGSFTLKSSTINESINFDIKSMPSVNFSNCSNITINFVTNKCRK